jgi:hypothetical protein
MARATAMVTDSAMATRLAKGMVMVRPLGMVMGLKVAMEQSQHTLKQQGAGEVQHTRQGMHGQRHCYGNIASSRMFRGVMLPCMSGVYPLYV